jgi:hypothetical protein
MAWVKAEYAGELAVVAAWVAALTPWSLTLQPNGPLGSILFWVRWPLGELQVRLASTVTIDGTEVSVSAVLAEAYPGSQVFGPFFVADPVAATAFDGFPAVTYGGWGWVIGALAVVVALGLSVALYRDEAGTTARLPVDPIRGMAGLLGLATLGFGAATVGLWFGPPRVGVPIPIGVVVVGALSVALARVERV